MSSFAILLLFDETQMSMSYLSAIPHLQGFSVSNCEKNVQNFAGFCSTKKKSEPLI